MQTQSNNWQVSNKVIFLSQCGNRCAIDILWYMLFTTSPAGAYPGVRLYAKTSTSFSQKKERNKKKERKKRKKKWEREGKGSISLL